LLWARHLQGVDWNGMRRAVGDMPHESLWWALAFTVASYLVYSSIDLLARRVVGHRIGAVRVLTIGFVSHACALNLGPAGAGFRFRLYMRHGLDAPHSAVIWLFNIASNWFGFVLIEGIAFAAGMMNLPSSWALANQASHFIGALLLGAVAIYLVACAMAHGRSWKVLGRELTLPTLGVAVLQCLVSALNWTLLAWLMTMLLQHKVEFASVLAALLTCALALALIDVPAGLGVTETVFLAMFASRIPAHELLAALLAYRAIYYLALLLMAIAAYLLLEFDAGAYLTRRGHQSEPAPVKQSPPARSHVPPRAALALHPRRSPSGSTRSPP